MDAEAYDLRHDVGEKCGRACSQLANERGNYNTRVFTRETIRIIADYSSSDDEQLLFSFLAVKLSMLLMKLPGIISSHTTSEKTLVIFVNIFWDVDGRR